jgi:hypothetical protein
LHHQRLAEPFVLHPSGIAFLAFCKLEPCACLPPLAET